MLKQLWSKSLIYFFLALMVFTCSVTGSLLTGHTMSAFAEQGEISSWAVSEVNAALEAGIVPKELTVDFQKNITRREFAMLVVKTLETLFDSPCTASEADTFTDTKEEAVLKAHHEGIVTGVSEKIFEPDTEISREQLAVMLMRMQKAAAEKKGSPFIFSGNNKTQFDDSDQCAPYAVEDIEFLVKYGFINGVSENDLKPKGTATIEQSILISYRLYSFMNSQLNSQDIIRENSGQTNTNQENSSQTNDSREKESAAFTEQVVSLVNVERTKNGLSPLKNMKALDDAAQARAIEQGQLYSHTRPDGTQWYTILEDYDFSYSGAAENIAYGYTTPERVVAGWMNSQGHRKNILGDFQYIGVGYYIHNNTAYWTQMFLN